MAINIDNRYSTRGDLVRVRATPARRAARAQEKEKSKGEWNMGPSARDGIFDAFKTRSGTLLRIKNLTLERTLSAALANCE